MSRLYLVGYGTLLDRASLGDSIGGDASAAKAMVPVRIGGYRRLFNLRPDHYEPSRQTTREPIEAAAMNVEPAADDEFNGLAFAVTEEELTALDQRERYYQRRSVTVLDFSSGQPIGDGHLYASVPDARWIERDPRRLLPRWLDIVLARRGAYAIGEEFGRTYDQTTFLADGRTLMVEAYRQWLRFPPEATNGLEGGRQEG